MTNRALIEEMQRMVAEGKLNQEDRDRLLFSAMVAVLHRVDEFKSEFAALNARMIQFEERMFAYERSQSDYPSLTWLLRYKPKQTVAIMIAIFIVLSLWFVSEFRQPLLQWFGLPVF